MEYRQLGETDIQLSAITFGAWAIGGWMWGGADRKEAVKAIQAAYAEGITSIDTAPVYGQGLSEEIVAEAIKGIPRDKVQILTKFGLRWDVEQGEYYFDTKDNSGTPLKMYKLATRESVFRECEDCLRRLNTDYIDLFQIHWPDATTPIGETMQALADLQAEGKIRAAGVCNYSLDQLIEADDTIQLASDQVPYSMVLRDIEKDIVPYAIKERKSIIAYSPLQRGLLTGKIKPGHSFNEGDTREGNRFYTEESIIKVNAFLDKLRPLAQAKNASLSQLVIRWTIEQPAITVALVGARNTEQAVQNARAIDVKLTPEELRFINEQLKDSGF
ncbi:MAG: aldo/keto reductase [Candidatus Pseudobacter hemicellulosilyticus]|uniref:Aldo/keto reductase n=1 Tax=Candidatus Pseudobacter hemicellulosilyticus TaxID=3121375 RepID=A0AAJ5WQT7_9BACT|nr:MAG: aldo/keto reductase [Pseudobacter sp.]